MHSWYLAEELKLSHPEKCSSEQPTGLLQRTRSTANNLAAKWCEKALPISGLKHIIISFIMHPLVQYLLHYTQHPITISCTPPLWSCHCFTAWASSFKLQLCINSEAVACHLQECNDRSPNLRELFSPSKPSSSFPCYLVFIVMSKKH